MASHGDEANAPRGKSSQAHRRVTFDDKDKVFGDANEAPISTPIPFEETVNSEWGVDGDDSPHPSTEHRERYTWRGAPSRRLINLTAGRHRESYDSDLLLFQAGSYTSDDEEVEYLDTELDGRLIRGVKFEVPEEDDDATQNTDEMPGQAHATPAIDAEDLANEPAERKPAPQAAIETRENICIVEPAPEIDIEFGKEPTIELSSFYYLLAIMLSCNYRHIFLRLYVPCVLFPG